MFNSNGILRGLATALSTSLTLSLFTISGFAATSNDLREYVGMPRNQIGSYQSYNPNTGYTNEDNPSENIISAVTDEDKQVEQIIQYVQFNKDVSEYEDIVNKLEDRLTSRIESGANAYIIFMNVADILEAKDNLNNALDSDFEYSPEYISSVAIPNTEDTDKDTTDESGENEESIINLLTQSGVTTEEMANISSLDYNIGGIGRDAFSVVENYLRLVTPWGFTKHASEETFTESKLLGIDLYALPGDNIKAQWNGVVVAIAPDISKTYNYIKVYHGNSTYTIYSHVYPVSGLYVGSSVRSGQIIAQAADTSEDEPGKDNHIFYQIKLNGEFINPIFIYGDSGRKIYEEWYNTYPYDNVIEAGEKYFNDVDESITSTPNYDDDVLDVIFPDFNKPEVEPITPEQEKADLEYALSTFTGEDT